MNFIEPLESRIAPAAVFSFVDGDGDKVTINASLGKSADLASGVSFTGNELFLNLAFSGTEFNGANVSITVQKNGGDGLVAVNKIDATGLDLGTVTVKGNLNYLTVGTNTSGTPAIAALNVNSLGRYKVTSSAISINGDAGAINVKHDVDGSYINITGSGNVGSLSIGGSVLGGLASNEGQVHIGGNVGTLKIGGDIRGTSATSQNGNGEIYINNNLTSGVIGGSLIGGKSASTGALVAHSVGSLKIGGDLRGSGYGDTGLISLFSVDTLTVGGSIIGGGSNDGGEIAAVAKLGTVKIGHDVIGGGDQLSGSIDSQGQIDNVTIGGSVFGGGGNYTGAVLANPFASSVKVGNVTINGSVFGGSGSFSGGVFNSKGSLGNVIIKHNLVGGSHSDTGDVSATGEIASVTIGGSIFGGTANYAGRIVGYGGESDTGTIKIGHNIIGGAFTDTGMIYTTGIIENLTIGGSIFSGTGSLSGSVRVYGKIGTMTVNGNLQGMAAHPVYVTAQDGLSSDTAFDNLTVKGKVDNARILAGFDPLSETPTNGKANIGKVTVGGNWIASDLVAGVKNLGADDATGGSGVNADNVNFGDLHDRFINVGDPVTKIASIIIGGHVYGTTATGDAFGFVAHQIDAMKVGGFVEPLNANPDIDDIEFGGAADVALHEV